MPKWSHNIPDDPRGQGLPIQRTPASRPLQAIVTSEDIVGTYTHFYKGRTMPCESPECDACAHGHPYRWHAYLAAFDRKAALHFIFECTAQSAEAFTEYRDTRGTLRGAEFCATRMGQKHNGRILIRCRPADLAQCHLPQPPDVIKCLAILWSMPIPTIATEHLEPEKKMPHVRPPKKPKDSPPPSS